MPSFVAQPPQFTHCIDVEGVMGMAVGKERNVGKRAGSSDMAGEP